MADDDFGRAVTWGCGVHLGWILGGLLVSLLSLAVIAGSIFLCCGGLSCAALNSPGIGTDRAGRSQTEVAINSAKRTPTSPSPSAPPTERDPLPSPPPVTTRKEPARPDPADEARKEAQREANHLAQNEDDAKTLLDLAKRNIDQTRRAKALRSLIDQYPKTKAADEARKLLK